MIQFDINEHDVLCCPPGSVGIPAERLAELERIERAWLPIYLTHQAVPTERLEALERLETLWRAFCAASEAAVEFYDDRSYEEAQHRLFIARTALEAWQP